MPIIEGQHVELNIDSYQGCKDILSEELQNDQPINDLLVVGNLFFSEEDRVQFFRYGSYNFIRSVWYDQVNPALLSEIYQILNQEDFVQLLTYQQYFEENIEQNWQGEQQELQQIFDPLADEGLEMEPEEEEVEEPEDENIEPIAFDINEHTTTLPAILKGVGINSLDIVQRQDYLHNTIFSIAKGIDPLFILFLNEAEMIKTMIST